MKIGIVIQARMGSSRLPGKILLKLPFHSNMTVLENILNRAEKVNNIDNIVVATTVGEGDNIVEDFCKERNIEVFRGSEDHVLSRFYYLSKKYNFDQIIRLTADNPCIDFKLIESCLDIHLRNKNDYTETISYPLGTNIEIVSMKSLSYAFNNTIENYDTEHVTPFVRNHPDLFQIETIEANDSLARSDIRVTLDKEQDYVLLCQIFDYLYSGNQLFGIDEIINLFEQKPWLKNINLIID